MTATDWLLLITVVFFGSILGALLPTIIMVIRELLQHGIHNDR